MPRAVSTVQAARPASLIIDPAPVDLILPAPQIFDAAAVAAALDDVMKAVPDDRTLRAATVGILKQAQTRGRDAIRDAFLAQIGRAHV